MLETRVLIALLARSWLIISALLGGVSDVYGVEPPSALSADRKPLSSARRRLLPIAPSLRGFGITTVGGSGRHLLPPRTTVLRVSSLLDTGPGTLRACVEFRAPRTCIFEVAGEIKLATPLRVRSPFISIAGQTAPSPGITISHGGFQIETHDVFIQHIAIRPGDSPRGVPAGNRDGISVGTPAQDGAYNVVLDQLSLTWAIDENISTWYETTRDVTISNSIIAEGLHRSIHPKGPHSKGVMVGDNSKRVTLYRNLISSNEERNPYLKPGSETEIINNAVYGWGGKGAWSLCNLTNNERNQRPVKLSFIGNTYIPGPWSYLSAPVFSKRLAAGSRIYTRDNQLVAPAKQIAGDRQETSRARFSLPYQSLVDRGYTQERSQKSTKALSSADSITALPQGSFRARRPPLRSKGSRAITSDKALRVVLAGVGSRPFDRSPIDVRIISDVIKRVGSLKDCISGCAHSVGPLPVSQTTTRSLRVPPRPFDDDNRDGYTNLENWILEFRNSSVGTSKTESF